jgi:hypothetical protein
MAGLAVLAGCQQAQGKHEKECRSVQPEIADSVDPGCSQRRSAFRAVLIVIFDCGWCFYGVRIVRIADAF